MNFYEGQQTFSFLPPKLTKVEHLQKGHIPPGYKGDGLVYLLHFAEEIGGDHPKGKARHYVGYVHGSHFELRRRLNQHAKGYKNSSKLTRYLFEQGISFDLGMAWEGVSPDFERVIKDHRKHKDFCLCCENESRSQDEAIPFF